MSLSFRIFGIFLISFITGTLYAVVVGLLSGRLRAPLYSWPVWTGLFWVVFWKFNLIRYVGFIWALPVSLLGFELIWTRVHPGIIADKYTAADRSHYIPGLVTKSHTVDSKPDTYGAGLGEILIGPDGFRSDPKTGRGNPPRCRYVLIGDSMIYGSGLPYGDTLGPVLGDMGLSACVFAVTGNSPVDYLATLKFVEPRIDPGAYIAFYLYAYNDFVSLNKYYNRKLLSLSNRYPSLFEWARSFDQWRKSTFIFQRFRGEHNDRSLMLWKLDAVKNAPIQVHYPHDPGDYQPPKRLNARQRVALKLFFDSVTVISRERNWRVSMVIHPDNAEFYTNLSHQNSQFVDLDPRRADALNICKQYDFFCVDISSMIYERALAEGKNPYFTNDRHFSAAGTHIVADSFVWLTRQNRLRP